MEDLASEVIRVATARSRSVCLVTDAFPSSNVVDVELELAFAQRRVRREGTMNVFHIEEKKFTRDSQGTDTVVQPFTPLATFHTASVAVRCLLGGVPSSVPHTLHLTVDDAHIAKFHVTKYAVNAMNDIVLS